MKKVLTSIWFIAGLVTLPILLMMPRLFEKYVVTVSSKEAISYRLEGARVFYDDLYGDKVKRRVIAGNSEHYGEKRRLIEFSVDRPVFVLYGQPGREMPKIFFGNADKDSNREILGFTYNADSLFLNVCELGSSERTTLPETRKYFIEFPEEGLAWTRVKSCDFVDLNGDGKDEVVFVLTGHYAYEVRSAVMILDTNKNKLIRSKVIGDQFHNLRFVDVDGDGLKEIISDGQHSSTKAVPGLYLGDGNPYLKILDLNLNFKYPPVKFKKGVVNAAILHEGNEVYCYVLSNRSLVEQAQTVLYKTNYKGQIIDSLEIEVDRRANICHIETTKKGNILAFTEKGKIHKISKNLELLEVIDLGDPGQDVIVAGVYDINEDGVLEFFCHNFKSGDNLIYTDEFQYRLKYGNALHAISGLDCKIGKNSFFAQDGKFSYIYAFKKNPLRYFEYPGYLAIYLLIVFFVFVVRKTQEVRLKEKYELQNKVRELQLKSINNQLDPHFIFNTFNTVASVVKQGKSEEAYDLMVKFSKLVRKNMEDAGDINTTLKSELDFVTDYLAIQKFRFKDLFNYTIRVDKGLNTVIKIPKLLVQIHVENALKHGIRPAKKQGVLKIDVAGEEGSIRISVEDNGVGRNRSKILQTSGHGIGLKAISELIGFNNQSSLHKITQEIIDLKDENGTACGTKVVLRITI